MVMSPINYHCIDNGLCQLRNYNDDIFGFLTNYKKSNLNLGYVFDIIVCYLNFILKFTLKILKKWFLEMKWRQLEGTVFYW